MTAGAATIAAVYLSLAALAGLAVVARSVTARGAWEPLNRRFLFGLRVTMALFAGRAALALTGVEAFRAVVLAAAALIPLAVLLLTEGLLRRHAPGWAKALVAVGGAVFVLLALVPGAFVDPARLWALMGFQIAGFVIAGWLVAARDRASLTAAENRAVGRLALSLVLLVPLGAADYLMDHLGLPVQVSAIGVLVLCWLAVGLGRADAGYGGTLAAFGVMAGASLAAGAVLVLAFGLEAGAAVIAVAAVAAAVLLSGIVNDARSLAAEERSLTLLRQMAEAEPGAGGPVAFLRGLQTHPAVEGAALIEGGSLADLDEGVLRRVFEGSPVLRRAGPPPGSAEEREHVAVLFERFEATHVLLAAERPLLLVALSMPSLAASPRAELELRAVQRMAALMAGRA